jgi:glutathione synthase/RimK-type ligase-like ATP-grasp enzyme
MSSPKVIIFALTNDAHAGAVDWSLKQNGAQVLWGPSLRFNTKMKYSFKADESGIHPESRTFSSGVSAVWNRYTNVPDATDCMPEDRLFVTQQWDAFDQNAFALPIETASALWLNEPLFAARAENKLFQLKAAHKVGLRYPETYFSNDADDVRKLIDRWGKVVLKTFIGHVWESHSTKETHRISVAMLDQFARIDDRAVAICPSIYQRYVEKEFDVRVAVLGDRIFAAKIQRNEGPTYMDWRPHILDEDVSVEEFTLPETVANQIHGFMHEMGLTIGFIDLVMDLHGDLHFLEVNQQGQFLFVEEKVPRMPILQAMTSLLLTGRSDYSVNDSKKVHFADYLQSREFSALREAPQRDIEIISYEA